MAERAWLALLLLGCEGMLAGGDAGGMDSAVPPGTDAGRPRDTGVEPPFDAGPCTGSELADAFSMSPIAATTSGGLNLHAAATSSGGAVIAYASGGAVHLVRVDGAGVVQSDVTIAGNEPWGVATSGAVHAAIVDRGSDELHLVGIDTDGSERFDTLFLGGVPHDVTNNEWFGNLLRGGRLDWNGSQWAAYVTVQRLWDDGIAHYGDTVRLFDADGNGAGNLWGWGCSHSIELDIAHNASGFGPACISDCFPDKGVFFHHQTQVFLDPSGDCMGGIATRMGGIAADASGFLIAFASPEGRSSMDVGVARVGNDRSVGAIVWLTADGADDGDVRVAPYAGGFLVGWRSGASDVLQRVDAQGNAIGAAAMVPAALSGSSDFFAHGSGDVGWVSRSGGGLSLARVRACL